MKEGAYRTYLNENLRAMIVTYFYKRLEGSGRPRGERTNKVNFRFLELFLKSLSITNPNQKIILEPFNLSQKECSALKLINKNLSINKIRTDKNVSFLQFIDKNFFPLIERTLPNYKKLIYMDVDCLVRGSLKKAYDILDDNDIAMQTWKNYTNWKKNDSDDVGRRGRIIPNSFSAGHNTADEAKICCGIWMAKNNKKAINFLSFWRKLTDDSNPKEWYSGQLALLSTYTHFTEKKLISFYDLPQDLHDMDFEKSSTIWHANMGDKKENLKEFEIEIQNLRNESLQSNS